MIFRMFFGVGLRKKIKMTFEVKIYQPVDGKLVLKERISGQEVADRTFEREMSGKQAQMVRWRKQAKKPNIKCLNCPTTFRKIANRKFCSTKCGIVYRYALAKKKI